MVQNNHHTMVRGVAHTRYPLSIYLDINNAYKTTKLNLNLNAFKPPPPDGLGCCPFYGGGSVVVDLLFIVIPMVGVCNCSMFSCT